MELIVGIVTATPDMLLSAVALAAKNSSKPMSLAIHANGFEPDVAALRKAADLDVVLVRSTPENIGVTRGFHHIWEATKEDGRFDLISYMHDDLDIFEKNWDARVVRCFEKHPNCAVASFNGAIALGSDVLYKTPYELQQLARHRFMSNMTSAERHGERVTVEMKIATFDSFSMICRMSFLDKIGGWNWYPYPCHNIDNSIACMVARHGLESWFIPVECEHHGGTTSTKAVYHDYAKKEFGGDVKIHSDSHLWMYNEFRDVLPIVVPDDGATMDF